MPPYIGTVSNQAGAVTAPTGLTATTITTTQINLSWTAASGSVTGYKLYRGTTSGGENTLLYNSTGTSFNDTGLTAGTSYYYTVEAVNGSLISARIHRNQCPDDSERPDWSDRHAELGHPDHLELEPFDRQRGQRLQHLPRYNNKRRDHHRA